jgi:hypothetical protein
LSKELAIALGRHEGQVFFCDPRIAGHGELIEDLIAGSPLLRRRHIINEALVGKFLRKYEGAGGDALSDIDELLARALEVRFGGAALQRWAVADTVELEIELDAVATEGNHATMYGFTAHRVP